MISCSPGELKPVFQAMLANATRLCEAKIGNLHLCEGDALRIVAMHNSPPAYGRVSAARSGSPPRPAIPGLAVSCETKQTVHIEDIMARSAVVEVIRIARVAELVGARTFLAFRCSRTTGWSA